MSSNAPKSSPRFSTLETPMPVLCQGVSRDVSTFAHHRQLKFLWQTCFGSSETAKFFHTDTSSTTKSRLLHKRQVVKFWCALRMPLTSHGPEGTPIKRLKSSMAVKRRQTPQLLVHVGPHLTVMRDAKPTSERPPRAHLRTTTACYRFCTPANLQQRPTLANRRALGAIFSHPLSLRSSTSQRDHRLVMGHARPRSW